MHPRITPLILLILILALTLPVFTEAAPATGNARQGPTAPTTTTTAAPVTTVACTAPCQCLAYADAVSQWGASGFTQCAEHPCEVTRSATEAPVEKFCYKQKAPVAPTTTTPSPTTAITSAPVTTVTTQFAFPAITTPVNQIASTRPTTSPTPTLAQFSDIHGSQTFGNKTFQQPVLTIGNYLYRPHLGLDSPYTYLDPGDLYLIQTFLETDRNDNEDRVSSGEMQKVNRIWTDYSELTIDKNDTRHVGNFRFNSSVKNAKMFLWQVSRFPFPNDPKHWQAEYIPGLVAYGPVEPTDKTVDSDGFLYFRINFAKVAGRNPGDPPYYSGTAHFDPAGTGGRVVVADVSRLPLNLGGVVVKKVNLGIVSLNLPTAYTKIPPGEYTESEMAYPGKNLVLTCAECAGLRAPSSLENLMIDEDQKFSVRLVPIYNDDTAGIPSIPVEVTVHRPHPCPVINGDVTVKPPSARIVWYMRPGFGAQGGDHTRWVTIGDAAFWNVSVGTNSESSGGVWSGGIGSITSSMMGKFDYYGSGFHYIVPPAAPAEKSWWDKMVGAFETLFNYISFVVNQYAQLWNVMKDQVVNATASILSYTLTGGTVKCEDIPGCKDVLHTALDMAMVAVGLPPTLPTSSELSDMGTEYMIKLGADQLGAGEAYNTAKDLYKDVPDFAKQPMKDAAESGARELVNGETDARHNLVFNGQNCEQLQYCSKPEGCFRNCVNATPDPIFTSFHPATVMVWVENPNTAPSNWVMLNNLNGVMTGSTDKVVMTVSDSWNVYTRETRIIPSLKPGEGISVPVVLYENYWQFRKENGGPCEWDGITHTDTYSSSVWTNQEICEHQKWDEKFYKQGEDSFKVTFSVRNAPGNTAFANLDETSSGKWAGTFIISDNNCVTSHIVRYPPGWQIYTTGYSINPQAQDILFEENGVISPTRGYMRKK